MMQEAGQEFYSLGTSEGRSHDGDHSLSNGTTIHNPLVPFGLPYLSYSTNENFHHPDTNSLRQLDIPLLQNLPEDYAPVYNTESYLIDYSIHSTSSSNFGSQATTTGAFTALALADERKHCYYETELGTSTSEAYNQMDCRGRKLLNNMGLANTDEVDELPDGLYTAKVGLDPMDAGIASSKVYVHGETLPGGMITQCLICGDRATGKHYGAYSCDGCKGFFRRSVRRNHSYTCRQKRVCLITKDKRNQCRFCRLRKCFRVGMKKSAVQNERDKISNRPTFLDVSATGQSLLDLQQLMQAETRAHHSLQHQQLGSNLVEETPQSKANLNNSEGPQLADVTDICESIKTQLSFLIEWARNLHIFTTLTLDDQIALLQSHAGEMLILGAVWRSLSTATLLKVPTDTQNMRRVGFASETGTDNEKVVSGLDDDTGSGLMKIREHSAKSEDSQVILLGNHRIISEECSRPEVANIAKRILTHLYQPMQELCLEDAEVACLRAIVFFDPNCEKLSDQGKQLVQTCQYQIQNELMHLMNDKLYLPSGRFGALLLLLPELHSITQRMIIELQLAKQMGFNRLDGLLSEVLLSRQSENSNSKSKEELYATSELRENTGGENVYCSYVTTSSDEVRLISDVTGICIGTKPTVRQPQLVQNHAYATPSTDSAFYSSTDTDFVQQTRDPNFGLTTTPTHVVKSPNTDLDPQLSFDFCMTVDARCCDRIDRSAPHTSGQFAVNTQECSNAKIDAEGRMFPDHGYFISYPHNLVQQDGVPTSYYTQNNLITFPQHCHSVPTPHLVDNMLSSMVIREKASNQESRQTQLDGERYPVFPSDV